MDMSRVSGLCDRFVVCDASSKVRAKTIAEHVQLTLKKLGHPAIHRDGMREGDWIVLDFGDVIIHIFLTEMRHYYSLEELWGDAPHRKHGSHGSSGKKKE